MTLSKTYRKKVSVNGINLFYRDTESDLQPMLCLHGRWGRGETWADFFNRYGNKYRIIAPDQRGHGLSDKPVGYYNTEVLAEDACQLIEALDCLKKVIAVGHSMGGRVAAYLSAMYPEKVFALAVLDETAEWPYEMLTVKPEELTIGDGFTSEWPTPFASYKEAVKFLKSQCSLESNIQYFLDSLIETKAGFDFMFSPFAMTALGEYNRKWFDILPKIKCPTLLVRAADSWCLMKKDAEKMIPLIKNCTYFEVSNSDHMVYADNPDEFYPGFERFLANI